MPNTMKKYIITANNPKGISLSWDFIEHKFNDHCDISDCEIFETGDFLDLEHELYLARKEADSFWGAWLIDFDTVDNENE